MGTPIVNPWEGGGRCVYLREVLIVGGTGNTTFWVGKVGGDPLYIN